MSADRRTNLVEPLLASAVIAVSAALYFFFISAGMSPARHVGMRYYDMLADGFLDGHVHLRVTPSPALLAQPDPYDFETSRRLWLWDASLYKEKYYFYWGPVPAAFVAAIKLIGGRDIVVPDRHLVFFFVFARLVVGAVLLVLLRRWLFPRASPWTLAPILTVFALANPYLYQLGRPGVYEASIDSAQFFVLAGMLSAFVALRGSHSRARELGLLAAAGCCWAAALGCRVSIFLAVPPLVVVTALLSSWNAPSRTRELVVHLCVVGAPVALGVVGLGFYNYARFESFTEFGTNYQLTRYPYSPATSLVLPNLHAYLLRRFTVSCKFPFLGAPFFAYTLTPAWLTRTTGYMPKEPLVGLFIGAPVVVFGAAAISRTLRLVRSRMLAHGRASHVGQPAEPLHPGDVLYIWIVACCVATILLAAVPTLGMSFSTMRYLTDVTPAALILAAVGFWTLMERGRHVAAVKAAGTLLAVYTVSVGLLLGFQGGYFGAIRARNPALYKKLVGTLSLCDQPPAYPQPPRTGARPQMKRPRPQTPGASPKPQASRGGSQR